MSHQRHGQLARLVRAAEVHGAHLALVTQHILQCLQTIHCVAGYCVGFSEGLRCRLTPMSAVPLVDGSAPDLFELGDPVGELSLSGAEVVQRLQL